MTCPECSKSPMTLVQSIFRIDPRNVTCRHCGAHLKLARPWVQSYWASLIIGFILGACYAMLRLAFSWENALLFLLVWIGLAVVFSMVFWRYARYEAERGEAVST